MILTVAELLQRRIDLELCRMASGRCTIGASRMARTGYTYGFLNLLLGS